MSDHIEHPCRLCGSLLYYADGLCGACYKAHPDKREETRIDAPEFYGFLELRVLVGNVFRVDVAGPFAQNGRKFTRDDKVRFYDALIAGLQLAKEKVEETIP